MGVASLGSNLASGNYGGAAVDAVGLVVDATATAVPGVPGGAGTAIKASWVTAKQIRNTERSKFAASRAKALVENGGKCNYCGKAEATVGDHIDSLKSYAGEVNAGTMTKSEAAQAANAPENIAGACVACNAEKSANQLSATPGEGKFVPSNPSPRIEDRLKP